MGAFVILYFFLKQGLTVRPEPVEGWAVKPFAAC